MPQHKRKAANAPSWLKKPIPKLKVSFFPPTEKWYGVTKPRDWPEDLDLQDGSSSNTCYRCKHVFVGHKHRYVCKICYAKSKKRLRNAYMMVAAALILLSLNITILAMKLLEK